MPSAPRRGSWAEGRGWCTPDPGPLHTNPEPCVPRASGSRVQPERLSLKPTLRPRRGQPHARSPRLRCGRSRLGQRRTHSHAGWRRGLGRARVAAAGAPRRTRGEGETTRQDGQRPPWAAPGAAEGPREMLAPTDSGRGGTRGLRARRKPGQCPHTETLALKGVTLTGREGTVGRESQDCPRPHHITAAPRSLMVLAHERAGATPPGPGRATRRPSRGRGTHWGCCCIRVLSTFFLPGSCGPQEMVAMSPGELNGERPGSHGVQATCLGDAGEAQGGFRLVRAPCPSQGAGSPGPGPTADPTHSQASAWGEGHQVVQKEGGLDPDHQRPFSALSTDAHSIPCAQAPGQTAWPWCLFSGPKKANPAPYLRARAGQLIRPWRPPHGRSADSPTGSRPLLASWVTELLWATLLRQASAFCRDGAFEGGGGR